MIWCRMPFVDAGTLFCVCYGGVAQLGEHHVRNVGVKGSNPSVSILFLLKIRFMKSLGSRKFPGFFHACRDCWVG